MKKIGILTSGGDAPGMNACIRAAVRAAQANDLAIFGIRRGYAGLIRGEIEPLDRKAVRNIIHQGGTILGTARSQEFMTREGRAQAIDNLTGTGVEGLILIGGDGTFRGGTELAEECGICIIGVPGTIDNDIYGTDSTIGFDTAVNCALAAIDRIRDTAMSHERLFFLEVMGRHTGFIALESGMAGGAEELLIPEVPMSIDDLCMHLERAFKGDKKSAIVVVAETDQPGDSFRIAEEVRSKLDLDSRVCILGHLQRGGSPTARDRVLAGKLGVAAVQALLASKSGYMVGEVNWRIAHTPLRDTWHKEKELNADLLEMRTLLCE
jgi:6-phosphofructokinase 1